MTGEPIGIIAGSGFVRLNLDVVERFEPSTPFGRTTSELLKVRLGRRTPWLIARHGPDHSIAPHEVNYRANVWALHARGVRICIGLNWVGGIAPELAPGELALPDQLIDYTCSRESTFGPTEDGVRHIEFTDPFDLSLRSSLAQAFEPCGLTAHGGVYGVTQGPRLETAAEIDRLERDGCAMVGMTAMPEAGLARELGIRYAILAAVVNRAAGRGGGGLHTQMHAVTERVTTRQRSVIEAWLARADPADL